jgi:hypothetical protein
MSIGLTSPKQHVTNTLAPLRLPMHFSSRDVITRTVLIESRITMEIRPYCVIFFIPLFPRLPWNQLLSFFARCWHTPLISVALSHRQKTSRPGYIKFWGGGTQMGGFNISNWVMACKRTTQNSCDANPKPFLEVGETVPGTHYIRGWVGLKVGLDIMEKGKILPLTGIEPRPSSQ